MSDALEQATRAVLRAIRNKDAPPGDGGAYIWAFHDSGDNTCEAGVFNAERFALHDPERFANWITGKEPNLNPPCSSDRDAIKLLPTRLQRKIRNYEQNNENQSPEAI